LNCLLYFSEVFLLEEINFKYQATCIRYAGGPSYVFDKDILVENGNDRIK